MQHKAAQLKAQATSQASERPWLGGEGHCVDYPVGALVVTTLKDQDCPPPKLCLDFKIHDISHTHTRMIGKCSFYGGNP